MNKNIIQLRNGFVNLNGNVWNGQNMPLAMSVASELLQFGYLLDRDAIEELSIAPKADVIKFHDETITWLKKMTGATRNYRPFWKGFPEEVMEKSECELWLHQIVHYLSNGTYEPSEWTKERPTAFENSSYTVITKGDEDRYLKIFTDLVSVNQSLTPDDLKFFVESGADLRFPATIPFKENLCTLAGMGLNVPVKTVTDVLRIAVHMSGGDISLPKVPAARVRTNRWSSRLSHNVKRDSFKFKKFSRKERKYLLGLLEQTNCDIREFALKDNRWVRLGEILHPGEYRQAFPKAYAMFDKIRNESVKTWYGEVDAAFNKSFSDGLKKLSERPGEFIRRVDFLVRSSSEAEKALVFQTLEKIAEKSSNKVLYETYAHFEKRNSSKKPRTIMVKGSRKKTVLPELPALPQQEIDTLHGVIRRGLSRKFSTLPSIGKVWIDENLKKIPLPTNMRSMSSSLKPKMRGERIPMGNKDAKVIRAYVHWFDEYGDQDIDLTATFVGMGFYQIIGWNGEHSSNLGCYSGDVRHRQGACAEYIDIDVAKSLKAGARYVILDARNYNGGSFESVKECVFGYMEREFPEANRIFVPSTISNAVRLTSESSNSLVAMIDLETNEYIMLDIDQGGIPVASANVDQILSAVKEFSEIPAFSVYHLLEMHAKERGTIVNEKQEAETALSFEDFSGSYIEILKWMGV